MDERLYAIQDGVRRAKAAWLCGQQMIEAQVKGGPIFPVPSKNLRSPHKDEIDVSDVSGFRWERVLRGTRAGGALPPFEILPGTYGKTMEEVRVPLNELDLFRECASHPAPGPCLHPV